MLTNAELERIRDEAREADEGEWMEAADLADHLFDKADARHIENCSPDRVEAWAQEILEWRVLAEAGVGMWMLRGGWRADPETNVPDGCLHEEWKTLDEARATLAAAVRGAKTGRE